MAKFGPEADPRTYAIIGAAMEVHRQLGPGFLEAVYRVSMCRELKARRIEFESEVPLAVFYKQSRLPRSFRADFVCFGSILVELKAVPIARPADLAQVINYLRASGLSRGLLINFGGSSLQFRRISL